MAAARRDVSVAHVEGLIRRSLFDRRTRVTDRLPTQVTRLIFSYHVSRLPVVKFGFSSDEDLTFVSELQ